MLPSLTLRVRTDASEAKRPSVDYQRLNYQRLNPQRCWGRPARMPGLRFAAEPRRFEFGTIRDRDDANRPIDLAATPTCREVRHWQG